MTQEKNVKKVDVEVDVSDKLASIADYIEKTFPDKGYCLVIVPMIESGITHYGSNLDNRVASLVLSTISGELGAELDNET